MSELLPLGAVLPPDEALWFEALKVPGRWVDGTSARGVVSAAGKRRQYRCKLAAEKEHEIPTGR